MVIQTKLMNKRKFKKLKSSLFQFWRGAVELAITI